LFVLAGAGAYASLKRCIKTCSNIPKSSCMQEMERDKVMIEGERERERERGREGGRERDKDSPEQRGTQGVNEGGGWGGRAIGGEEERKSKRWIRPLPLLMLQCLHLLLAACFTTSCTELLACYYSLHLYYCYYSLHVFTTTYSRHLLLRRTLRRWRFEKVDQMADGEGGKRNAAGEWWQSRG
jgi:hypothetical protein